MRSAQPLILCALRSPVKAQRRGGKPRQASKVSKQEASRRSKKQAGKQEARRKKKEERRKKSDSSELIFKVPKKWSNTAYVDKNQYEKKYRLSIKDNEGFWKKEGKRIDWIKRYTKIKDVKYSKTDVKIKWFYDGTLNASANCIDRHLKDRKNKTAIIWVAYGAKEPTFYGLSGLGDLILTCNSKLSRNFVTGLLIGKGKKINEIIKTKKTVSEGVVNSKTIFKLSKKKRIEMPVCESVYKILYKKNKSKIQKPN